MVKCPSWLQKGYGLVFSEGSLQGDSFSRGLQYLVRGKELKLAVKKKLERLLGQSVFPRSEQPLREQQPVVLAYVDQGGTQSVLDVYVTVTRRAGA